MTYWRNALILCTVLSFCPSLLMAQEKEVHQIEYIAEETAFSQRLGKDIIRLIGQVSMIHEDLVLTCDSAHLNQKKRLFKGYGHVHLVKADTLQLWGDQIRYDGLADIVQMDGHVVMDNKGTLLKTKHLNYNMAEETVWYYDGGQILDEENVLESDWGYYYPDTEEYYFKDRVFLSNEDNTLSTDTLYYNSETALVRFLGSTQIFGDTNYIYCEAGWYDTDEELSSFYQNALFQSGDQVMKGDSLLYDRKNELFWAFGEVEARDTIENSLLYGQKLFYDEWLDRIEVTEDALYILTEEADSLFLLADTLLSYQLDTVDTRKIEAFHSVRFFREDIQGICDSLDYVVKDSVIQLFTEPVLWQGNNQLTAEHIRVRMNEDGMDYVELNEKAFLITEIDSLNYNQIKGKTIRGYFRNNELYEVEVDGNAQSIFYPEDDKGKIGVNTVSCSQMEMIFKEGKINRVKFIQEPDSKLLPLKLAGESEKKLEGFRWLIDKRPESAADLKKISKQD